jgi:NADP-dependent 3-hydroxy acid dehydrogenase YdfG
MSLKIVVTGLFFQLLCQDRGFSYIVCVTGVSGILGSAVYKAFKQNNYDVKGLAHSRANDELIKIDLTN